jgi:hypothetical protein
MYCKHVYRVISDGKVTFTPKLGIHESYAFGDLDTGQCEILVDGRAVAGRVSNAWDWPVRHLGHVEMALACSAVCDWEEPAPPKSTSSVMRTDMYRASTLANSHPKLRELATRFLEELEEAERELATIAPYNKGRKHGSLNPIKLDRRKMQQKNKSTVYN